jgi:hypothetical protein
MTAYRRKPVPTKMHIREYRDSDLAALRAIHASQGFDYALPDLSNPLFLTKLVLTADDQLQSSATPQQESSSAETSDSAENRAGNCPILGAALLRLTAEAYLLLDQKAGTPRERWQWVLALHEATRRDAWQRGLEDVHTWLPPPIAQKFGRRLTQLGWIRDDAWTPYCKRL